MLRGTLILSLFLTVLYVNAHEEPPKTISEKLKNESTSLKFRDNKIRKCIIWKMGVTDNRINLSKQQKEQEVIYDEYGNIAQKTNFHYFENQQFEYVTVFKYDSLFNMISKTEFDSKNEIISKILYEYDNAGRVKTQLNYTASGKLDSKFDFRILNDENTLLFTKHKPLDSVEYQIFYQYETRVDEGNNIEIIKQTNQGELLLRVENIFDNEGMRLLKRIFDENNQLINYFSYDYYIGSHEFKEIINYSSENKLLSKTQYILNHMGLVSGLISMDINNELKSVYIYEYYTD
jgi:hypothetical protein